MTVARLVTLILALAFVAGLAGTFGWTYREQSHRVARLQAERAQLRAENRRLQASVAGAQTALGTLGVALNATRLRVRDAARAGRNRYLDGYAAGYLWGSAADPLGGDTLDAGSTTGYTGR
jgi:type II secretory pathway pseudopilin PulG